MIKLFVSIILNPLKNDCQCLWSLLDCGMKDGVIIKLWGVCQGLYLLVIVKELEELNDQVLVLEFNGAAYRLFDETIYILSGLIVCAQKKAFEVAKIRLTFVLWCNKDNKPKCYAIVFHNKVILFQHFPSNSSRLPIFLVSLTQCLIHSLLNFFSLRMVLLLSSCNTWICSKDNFNINDINQWIYSSIHNWQ